MGIVQWVVLSRSDHRSPHLLNSIKTGSEDGGRYTWRVWESRCAVAGWRLTDNVRLIIDDPDRRLNCYDPDVKTHTANMPLWLRQVLCCGTAMVLGYQGGFQFSRSAV